MIFPRLRFKEFSGPWGVKKFGDVFSFMVTNSFSRELLNYDNGIVKNIHYGDIHKNFKSNFKIENENVPFINDDINISNISKDCYCKEGDLIIADASEDYADIGKSIEIISLNNQKLLAGLHTYIARDLSKQMALGFSGYLMQTGNVRLQIKTLATGISVLGISKGNLAKVNISVPSKPEQTKIANFLTAVDEKIAQLTQKGDLLARYKKGVMQQIFSQQLRFRDDDGLEFPDWEERAIENEVEFLSGYPFDGSDIKEDSKGIVLMRGINISEGFVRHSKEIDRYYLGDIKPLKKYLLIENDLVIGMDGSKVGKNSALIKKNDAHTLLVQRVARLRAKPNASISFIYQHINSSKFHSYVDKVNTSSGIPHISAKQIKEFKVFFPVFEEQTKIANFLTALDDKISHNQTQLNALKRYKQGLLQQLFV